MKKRLDLCLVEQGHAPTREKAKSIIMSGCVYVNGEREDKAGSMIEETAPIEVRGNQLQYVSRGGLKLEKAIAAFDIDVANCVCMDIGASTGGFTDCMLQNGASRVYAVDVGYGQLAWTLRQDQRVINLERTNIRYVTGEQVPEPLDFFSVDVAFISLKLVLPVGFSLLKQSGTAVALIKPQFEAGRDKVGKKGVVREKSTHIEVIETVLTFTKQMGFVIKGLTFSPIRGPEGNIEYLMYLSKQGEHCIPDIEQLVDQSHQI